MNLPELQQAIHRFGRHPKLPRSGKTTIPALKQPVPQQNLCHLPCRRRRCRRRHRRAVPFSEARSPPRPGCPPPRPEQPCALSSVGGKHQGGGGGGGGGAPPSTSTWTGSANLRMDIGYQRASGAPGIDAPTGSGTNRKLGEESWTAPQSLATPGIRPCHAGAHCAPPPEPQSQSVHTCVGTPQALEGPGTAASCR